VHDKKGKGKTSVTVGQRVNRMRMPRTVSHAGYIARARSFFGVRGKSHSAFSRARWSLLVPKKKKLFLARGVLASPKML
jgi:hypothetical protein